MRGKRVQIDDETWHILELLRRDKRRFRNSWMRPLRIC